MTLVRESVLPWYNYLHCFLTAAYKMTSRPSILAGTSDSKNPDPYLLSMSERPKTRASKRARQNFIRHYPLYSSGIAVIWHFHFAISALLFRRSV